MKNTDKTNNIKRVAYAKKIAIFSVTTALVFGCGKDKTETELSASAKQAESNATTPLAPLDQSDKFANDVNFLNEYVNTIVLTNEENQASIAVVPDWQGRIVTATTGENDSLGWLNKDLIKQGVKPENQREGLTKHIYAFGGADRFWIGPEGGQFSWYFPKQAEFKFENWKVPAFIDTNPWQVSSKTASSVTFEHQQVLQNWSGIEFDLSITRQVSLISESDALATLGLTSADSLSFVGYESLNTITNSGEFAWTKSTGMPSIWILGMLNHGPETTVVIPYRENTDNLAAKQPIVKDDYFGKVPASRLKVDESAKAIYFSADGQYRSKIGVAHERSLGLAGSWDASSQTLTIVQYNLPEGDPEYVNSSWEIQSTPFIGDAINSYNDGPVDGGILGPFYEIETSSPALALAPKESYAHSHRTFHIRGNRAQLNQIALHVFGVSLENIEHGLDK